MGNTVGSMNAPFCNFFDSSKKSYILGLWCADGYHRTSSVGISTINLRIVNSFYNFFSTLFSKDRIKLKLYYPLVSSTEGESEWLEKVGKIFRNFSSKATALAHHLYVDSRPLLRSFRQARSMLEDMNNKEIIAAYFAGRFDGDGSLSSDGVSDCRIVYTTFEEAKLDKKLLEKLSILYSNIYLYKKAKTFCLYIYKSNAPNFISRIKKYSTKL
ncbi:hypothetical protein HYW83_00855 [Candidatus Peregrinibacteria bacterium]|nr:hypothetical protein [Candidatus Peregrinibacteria bacterium]